MRLVLTGVPGTGKTTLARQLARRLHAPVVDVNAFARQRGLARRKPGEREDTVALARLARALRAFLRTQPRYVVEGHLACEFALPAEAVVVLRCDPRVLARRLHRRRYSPAKLAENLLAETLDYALVQALAHHPRARVVQVDATRRVSPSAVLARAKNRRSDRVRWLPVAARAPGLAFVFRENPALSARRRARKL